MKYNFDSARTSKQIAKMRHLKDSNICAFCPKYFTQFHDNPIEYETKHWIVSKNDYPYKDTKLHLLLVAKKHVRSVAGLSRVAQVDFLEVITYLEKKFNLTSYAIGMRNGDIRFNGGSVEHLHAHLVVGDVDSANHEPIRFKMSSNIKK